MERTATLRFVISIAAAALIAGCGVTSQSSLPAARFAPAATRLTQSSEKVLYAFTGGTDGGDPSGSITFDASDNAYGTTHLGGIDSCGGGVGGGCGVVFELSPSGSGWSEAPLYAFDDQSDGGFPNAGVILDKNGNLYGAASTGGNFSCSDGCGVIYELQKKSGWAESVLHTFAGSDGQFPNAVLLPSANGTLYSTTWYGGSSGDGTVFSLAPKGSAWNEQVLYNFTGGTDGSAPAAGVIRDGTGNLYGTTYKYGGDNDGVAFELQKKSRALFKDRVLYTFKATPGGENPYAGLIVDAKGNLYGTTIEGGANESGVAFELVRRGRHWTEKVLHAFGASGDGSSPYAGLAMDGSGNLFGTTVFGGSHNQGVVYELSRARKGWNERILYAFTGGNDGGNPNGTPVLDASGNLYGLTSGGGQYSNGVVFEVTP